MYTDEADMTETVELGYRLLPGEQTEVFESDRLPDETPTPIAEARVRFRDLSGQQWVRHMDGLLEELEGPEPD